MLRARVMVGFASALLLSAHARAAPHPAADGHAWRDYVNVRYGYTLCVPSDLLKAQEEAPNGDGRTFTAPDGAELAVFGRNNVDGRTLAAAVKADEAVLSGADGRVTYRASGKGWAVYSGRNAQAIFYSKTFLRGDQLVIMQLKYPPADEVRYTQVLSHLNGCFRLGSPAF